MGRHRGLLVVALLAGTLVSGAGCTALRSFDEPALPGRLAVLADSALVVPVESAGGTVTGMVETMAGELLWARDVDRLMLPASVQKLFVAAHALYTLPENHRFQTRLFATGELDSTGVLHGDLILLGGWDPGLAGRPCSDWPWGVLDSLANELRGAGVRHVSGDLVAVARVMVPPGWEVDDLAHRWGPAISPLQWHDGLVTSWRGPVADQAASGIWPDSSCWTRDHLAGRLMPLSFAGEAPNDRITGRAGNPRDLPGVTTRIPAANPAALTADAMRCALRRAGIGGGDRTLVIPGTSPPGENQRALPVNRSSGTAGERPTEPPSRMLAKSAPPLSVTHESEPLDSLLAVMLRTSNNAWAEQLHFGAVDDAETAGYHPEEAASYCRGDAYRPRLQEVLDELKLENGRLLAVDACGMARRNHTTARTVQELLRAGHERWGERWLALMPRAEDRNSTLHRPLGDLGGSLRAKTGSLSHCSSLAGYVMDGERPVARFTIIINNAPGRAATARNRFVREMVALILQEYATGAP